MYTVHNPHTGKITEVYSAAELSARVWDTLKYYEAEQKRLQERNKELVERADEVVKKSYEDKIKGLQHRLSLSYGEFSSDKEKEAYKNFEERHIHDRLTSKSNGGRAPYLIPTGTGFGISLKVKCPICGEEEDITDTEAW